VNAKAHFASSCNFTLPSIAKNSNCVGGDPTSGTGKYHGGLAQSRSTALHIEYLKRECDLFIFATFSAVVTQPRVGLVEHRS
jgi:hypothetical protein